MPKEIRIEIQNVGCASLYNERPVRLVIAYASGRQVSIPLEGDPRHWEPGKTITLRHAIPPAKIAHIDSRLPASHADSPGMNTS